VTHRHAIAPSYRNTVVPKYCYAFMSSSSSDITSPWPSSKGEFVLKPSRRRTLVPSFHHPISLSPFLPFTPSPFHSYNPPSAFFGLFSFCFLASSWLRPIVRAVIPARPPSCMVSSAELGTITIVELVLSPS
jgi:hypothetical protein